MASETYGIEKLGFKNIGKIFRNLTPQELVEHELRLGEGCIGPNGALMVDTGKFTGRSPKDKFIVDEPSSTENIWWGNVNQKIKPEVFETLKHRVTEFLSGKDLYMFDGFTGADKKYQMPIRILTKKPWHAMFVRNMFLRPTEAELENFTPEFTILNAAMYFEKEYKELGLNSEVFIIFNLAQKFAIIGGTQYGGEMKKGIFSVMNYLLPLKKVMSMHCSANVGKKGDVALFFGLSGTGKTTLSTDPERALIGDDEHGWSDDGVFNLEGGCYAKVIDLDPAKEPDIYNAIRFESILENVVYDAKRKVDYKDKSKTENTRVSYPLHLIPNSKIPSVAGHPKNIIFLTCDAFGVLPPVARLTPEQASYHFLSGYTAKVAGTERGVTEPQATFSTCFGAAFMTLRPKVYADLLAEKVHKHKVKAYLVNTGWTGGAYGVGKRMNLPDTRKIITAILNGEIGESEWQHDSVFGFEIPLHVGGVDTAILNPRNTWADHHAFDQTRIKLAKMFIENFKKYADDNPTLAAVGPVVTE
ncbi:MAG: phosphoenolpyruvate carboxykinase (ATP) [Candidatus Lambdaproteobacteria bacterium RIFOXYD1_FULL_56_27]|uniref:Phosphoenolpyruvate carboxykinase (ATP) n=1 Tax=Candidatus Lambdaproteobacteria bacterium RIFOXYD2_FULL_56_26 TaxID=1817773 RepID=A0A1F6GLF5_9PROT|nr:MAG: phosphoenolpyruvate carboxykinase (ATP) [Candidatus Lambdaproteobacteria bacterium RIFOXYD2_FULL_56_26]OGH05461.1 MAG: phosphoenolpyruvate carboxykinase (ATP) [Candidatus Lambdaproteobacteria bacterium RIFOXYC1_FULL_56_13]OGH09752.1 MAG: phosphoenolpyruvate carboxykinase (ATP) [Candidatus Lambdaproteobacteria bacterium RIFOXYD1_FULL_56_27]